MYIICNFIFNWKNIFDLSVLQVLILEKVENVNIHIKVHLNVKTHYLSGCEAADIKTCWIAQTGLCLVQSLITENGSSQRATAIILKLYNSSISLLPRLYNTFNVIIFSTQEQSSLYG